MRAKINIGEAAKVAALCLPPVILSLIGLATMGRKPQHGLAARGKTTPVAKAAQALRQARQQVNRNAPSLRGGEADVAIQCFGTGSPRRSAARVTMLLTGRIDQYGCSASDGLKPDPA